jgi:hypothetical protein
VSSNNNIFSWKTGSNNQSIATGSNNYVKGIISRESVENGDFPPNMEVMRNCVSIVAMEIIG